MISSNNGLEKAVKEAIINGEKYIEKIVGTKIEIKGTRTSGILTGKINYTGRCPLANCKLEIKIGNGFRRETLKNIRVVTMETGKEKKIKTRISGDKDNIKTNNIHSGNASEFPRDETATDMEKRIKEMIPLPDGVSSASLSV